LFRLSIESDKNQKLLGDLNNLQRKIGNLEAELQDLRIAATRPQADMEQMQRTAENLTRENETWKHR
jgi:molecular chaperone GrpE (heat shock protein)